jgi:hypothetical protein
VVPGLHAERLEKQTCEHFNDFLKELVAHQRVATNLWLFRHDLDIDDLENWEGYCFAGQKLLDDLKQMMADGLHVSRLSLIVRGSDSN